MSALRSLIRPTPSLRLSLQRPYHTTRLLRLPYKDDQDRNTLKPRSTENTKSGSDQEVAGADPDAAFNPDKTSPEAAAASSAGGYGNEDPLEASGANQELSKPRGDEKSGLDKGPGEEVSKGGASKGKSAEKKGAPQKPYLDLGCGLGEGPFWDRENNIFRFTDIVSSLVYSVNLAKGPSSLKKVQYEDPISFTGEIADRKDSYLLGGKYGVYCGLKKGGTPRPLAHFWPQEERRAEGGGRWKTMRANDGAVDCMGRFWISATCDPEVTPFAPQAILFRLDSDGSFHRMEEGMTIPNGMSWSSDNKLMYLADTKDRAIYKYDFEAETGAISNKRLFFQTEEGTGPDGHAQDVDGNIWTAVWGAWKVVRISPEGEVTAEIELPTRCITAVAFAGQDVFITSEKEAEPEKYKESVKYQGAVFKCHVGVEGKPSFKAVMEWDKIWRARQ
ncbi:SMP-30/Gluconolaconase/LRE-like region domain-containing protein [Sarocladium implicatum]|nr:SMP-30/Gluconolaconase/LRE-like region domain-containing protein [Sarocladium implicatum]